MIFFMTGLDICLRTDSPDQPINCGLAGLALNDISGFPSRNAPSCKNGAAIVKVRSLNDSLAKWWAATTTAHELVHLMVGNYLYGHDGENDAVEGPLDLDCRKESLYLMSPSTSYTELYRICKNQELWSRCSIKQVAQFTSNWENVCPSSSTVNEISWYYILLVLICVK